MTTAYRVDPRTVAGVDVMGPIIEFLTLPEEGDAGGVHHRHDPAGRGGPAPQPPRSRDVRGPLRGGGGARRLRRGAARIVIRPGDVFHVPGGARHAFRNRTDAPAVMLAMSTAASPFFRDVGTPAARGAAPLPPSGETIRRFRDTARRYGYWNATPEENARLGLVLPAPR